MTDTPRPTEPLRKPDAYGLTSTFRERRGLPDDGVSGKPLKRRASSPAPAGLDAALAYIRAKADRIEAASPNQAHDLRRVAQEIEELRAVPQDPVENADREAWPR